MPGWAAQPVPWRVDSYASGPRHKVRFLHPTFGLRSVMPAPDDTLWITTSNSGGSDVVI